MLANHKLFHKKQNAMGILLLCPIAFLKSYMLIIATDIILTIEPNIDFDSTLVHHSETNSLIIGFYF